MTPEIPWREPERFAAGDTLLFQRYLHDYQPGDGWEIRGTVTDPNTGTAVANFVSAPSATDPTVHYINVPQFALALVQGEYVLSEEVINTGTNEKHQIYYGELEIGPDLDDGTATAPILTFAQQMIATLQTALLKLAGDTLVETDVQRNRFRKIDEADKLKQLLYWEEKRANEVNVEGLRNGRSNSNDWLPVFRG